MWSPIAMFVWFTAATAAEPQAIVLTGSVAPTGPAAGRVSTGDGADLALFYGSEQEGVVGTCGCEAFPKGGLGRVDAVVRAADAVDPGTPSLLLNAGAWLSNGHAGTALSPRAKVLNDHMVRALRLGRWDALNVAYRDLPGLADGGLRPGLVSANLRPPDGVPVVRYTVLEAGDLRVAVTGVTRDGVSFLWPDGTRWIEPARALTALVPEMRSHADLVVVLAHDVPRDVPRLAAIEGIDVVIEAAAYRERYDPMQVEGAVWVRSWAETTRLSELRLWLENGRVVRAEDRKIDLDPTLEIDARHDRAERRAQVALKDLVE